MRLDVLHGERVPAGIGLAGCFLTTAKEVMNERIADFREYRIR